MTPLTRASVGLEPTRSGRCPAHTSGLSATLPARPGPRGLSVGACHATGQGFPCCVHSPLPCVLPPLPRRNLSVHVSLASRPVPALHVSRPARRSLVLRPVWSLNRPWRPVASECFRRCRYLHHPLRLLPAGTTVAGRDSHPLKNGAFPRRTQKTVLSPATVPVVGRAGGAIGLAPRPRAAQRRVIPGNGGVCGSRATGAPRLPDKLRSRRETTL